MPRRRRFELSVLHVDDGVCAQRGDVLDVIRERRPKDLAGDVLCRVHRIGADVARSVDANEYLAASCHGLLHVSADECVDP